jgi:hypothetical protein
MSASGQAPAALAPVLALALWANPGKMLGAVNFLLHHRLAAKDLGSPAAAIGAMLPDLWRIADRRVRPGPRSDPSFEGEDGRTLAGVLAGIAHHLEADRWFHDAPVFVEGEKATREAIQAAGLSAPRMGLFAHILWELCLDGALVRAVGLGAILEELRDGFMHVARDGSAHRAATLHHFGRVARSDDDRAAFDQRMDRIAFELTRGPWIDGYQHGDGIAARLDAIRERVGLGRLESDERARLAGAIESLLDRAVDGVVTIERAVRA